MTRHAHASRRDGLVWALAALAGGLGPGLGHLAHAAGPDRSPDWPALTDIDGHAISADSWRGLPAVIVFWATWCAYCRRHNAHVDALFGQVDARRLRVLGVVLDADVTAARRYMAQQGYRFPVVTDDGRLRMRFTERRVLPMTCIVAASGELQQCIPGEMARDDVLALASLAKV